MNSIKNFQNSFKNLPSFITRAMMVVFLFIYAQLYISAQATLSLQGILKKANGIALEDGDYPITFKLYVVDSTQVKWTETQPEVEVISGIYSVILGVVTPLNLPFDKDYELGISIGSQEMRPRVRLTSAPYALALRGSTNQFPSSGLVLADEIKVSQGVLASGGAPGLNGVDKNGYAFTGNSGDNDSGLFSTQDGEVSLYVNNVEKLEVNATGATVLGTMGTNQVNINNNGGINYTSTQGSFQDWRLVDADDFSTGIHNWLAYAPLPPQQIGLSQTNGAAYINNINYGTFAGHVIMTNFGNNMLKKQYDIAGTFSQVKAKFRYYLLDTWNWDRSDIGIAGFSSNVNGSDFKIGWYEIGTSLNANGKLNAISGLSFQGLADIDHWVDVEMTAQANSNIFWLFIGAAMDGGASNDEGYAVGNVEIWVR